MSKAAIDALRDAAVAALEAGNYTLAIQKATAAMVYVGLTPDVSRDGESVGWNNSQQIQAFIDSCRRMAQSAAITAGGPFRQIPVTYERPLSDDGYA